ncbi:hypothetical protein I79_014535 [Cricetulus griseus]|uniref:Uncharacterized protein n=1 Tax=Cricetulus griseus TaxID=10029 RepID=G3HUC6_CRIGR|nr:hypothetical protein I79_014535 [Cricetulus griseus]
MPLSSGLLSLKHPLDLPIPASGLYFFLISPYSTPIEPLVTQTMYQASQHKHLLGNCWRPHSSQFLTYPTQATKYSNGGLDSNI